MKSCCVLQDHYDDERNKTVFHNTTPDLQDQDQDRSVQDQGRFFWSQAGLVLRPTVSDYITAGCPSYHPTDSVKTVKEYVSLLHNDNVSRTVADNR